MNIPNRLIQRQPFFRAKTGFFPCRSGNGSHLLKVTNSLGNDGGYILFGEKMRHSQPGLRGFPTYDPKVFC